MIEIGSKLSNRYTITQTIGQGGMANVYLARDLILDRDVAVKVLKYDFQDNSEAIQRFQREAMAASQLLHHNIVEVYDVDQEDGQQYIVMEYVRGTDLKQFIKDNTPITLELVVSIMSQILSAIELAHKHNLIHRDIKPQNILITENNQVKITDFGIAIAVTDTSITQTNTLLGSVHYLSPEQARGANATMKSDIYALGVVLYELITGQVPFDGESAVSVALKHFQEDFPRIRTNLDYVPQSLENVVMKAAAKNPSNRYQTVGSMLADLNTALSTSRMFEKPFEEQEDDQSIVVSPLKPTSHSEQVLAEVTAGPETVDEAEFQTFDPIAPVSKPKGQSRRLSLILGALLIVAMFLGGYYLYQETVKYVTVPNISKMTLEEAKKSLAKEDITINETQKEWHDSLTVGQVIDSDPSSGSRVKRNSGIDVIVSSGREQVELGNYVGEDYEPIRRMLTNSDFIVDRRDIATNRPEEEGVILDQSIDPGSKVVPSDNPITMYVGNYTETLDMQDFSNPSLDLDMVYRFAEGYGLNVEENFEFNDYIPEGQVISQSPESGTPLSPGDTIQVTVSQGPEEEQIMTANLEIYVEYLPTYADRDVDKEKPLPNKIQVFIGDNKNNIKEVARDFEITESQTIQLTLYIPSDGKGQYRITRDGEVYEESNQVYPQ